MTQLEPLTEPESSADSKRAAEWIEQNWVTAAAVLMLVLQLWWRAGLLAHSYFRQDDFQILDRGRAGTFDLGYLLGPVNGRLGLLGRAIAWVEAHTAFYNWTLASAVTLALLAIAAIALLRLLRTIFGDRPAILVPFAVYLVTPLLVPELTWWSATLSWLPLHIAIFVALNAHLHYVEDGRLRHVLVAALWIIVGLFSMAKAVLLPVVLLLVTSAFLMPGNWPAGVIATVRRHWKAWLAYLVVTGGYCLLIGVQLGHSWIAVGRRPSGGADLAFASSLARISLVPGSLGGPWRWMSFGSYAVALRTPVLTELSWGVALIIVVASIWVRKRAWRAWTILAVWLLLADVVPVLLGWSNAVVNSLLGADMTYVEDAVPIFVICASLAFWPEVHESSPYRAPRLSRVARTALTLNVAGVIIVGSLWSAQTYRSAATGAAARSYIATARVALDRAPPGSVIVSSPVPDDVMSSGLFGRASYTAQVLGPLATRSARTRWTEVPSGLIANPLIFDGEGRLWQAGVTGVTSTAPPEKQGCWPTGKGPTQIGLQNSLYSWSWIVQLWYRGPATTLGVQFGAGWHDVNVPSGSHDVFVPAPGSGAVVAVQNLGTAPGGCVTQLAVGTMQVSAFGQPVPAAAVSG